jgi:hypothetical protein
MFITVFSKNGMGNGRNGDRVAAPARARAESLSSNPA